MPKSVVPDPCLFTGALAGRHRYSDRDLIYEAYVKGQIQMHPLVPENLRGTYERPVCDPIIDHLRKIGVKAVELMPPFMGSLMIRFFGSAF